MNNEPIGIFDSGLGGLCALREIRRLLPNENLIYFGDTGRTPYGTRSVEKITACASQDVYFLLSKNVKAIVAACGTVSSVALGELKKYVSIPLIGIIDGACAEAARTTRNKRIGVMGTGATISSGVFAAGVRALDGQIQVRSAACPLLVPIVENNFINTRIATLATEHYMQPLVSFGADTVILGCTHFPLLRSTILSVYPEISLIDSGAEAAHALVRLLGEEGLLNTSDREGQVDYYVSDTPNNFNSVAEVFLGEEINGRITKIDIDSY